MNYYEHHLGDYAEATAHLSFVEDAAYSRCLRKYYATEQPLPADIKQVQRLVGARTKEEREAVEVVLKEFFSFETDGWHNERADEEIARYNGKRKSAKNNAMARWNALRPQSDGNAPASDSQCDRIADAVPLQCEGNALQSPDTSHHKERPRKRGTARPAKLPMPDDFALSAELAAYVTATIPDADPPRLFAKFQDQARAGGWTYADWPRAFQGYVRNCAPGSGHFAAGQYPKRAKGLEGVVWQ